MPRKLHNYHYGHFGGEVRKSVTVDTTQYQPLFFNGLKVFWDAYLS